MAEILKDQEWFHRASLTPVRIQFVEDAWIYFHPPLDLFESCKMQRVKFEADYVRNDKLTIAWLEAEGWAVDESSGEASWQFGPDDWVTWSPNTEPEDVPWGNGTFYVQDEDGKKHVFDLPWPERILDLMQTLRYGVGFEFVLNAHCWPEEPAHV